MPARLFANAVASSTCASAINNSQTTITLQSTSGFLVPAASQQFSATILDSGNPAYNANNPLATPYEYVYCTGNNQGTNTLTVQRGQAGTSGRAFFAGATVSATLLADDLVGAFMRIDLPYFLRIHQNTAQTIAGGGAGLPVQFDTVDEDPTNSWNPNPNWWWAAPAAGRYEIKFSVKAQPVTAGIVGKVYVNNAEVRHWPDAPGISGQFTGIHGTTRIKVNAADHIQVWMSCSQTLTTVTSDTTSACWLEIYYVGAP